MSNPNSECDFSYHKYELLPDDFGQYDLSFKIIVIGDSGVGKSCLTNKATKDLFETDHNATIGFEFFSFNVKIDGKVVKLQIWDTCGQEAYRSLITNFYRNSSLAIMVYSIDNRESFDNIGIWLKELKTHSNPDAKVFLIGNKCDLENERKVQKEEGLKFINDFNLNFFIESSAKTGINAKNIFIKAAFSLYDDYLKYKEKNPSDPNNVDVKITGKRLMGNENEKKKGCCS
jgi:small GTP-binding protein